MTHFSSNKQIFEKAIIMLIYGQTSYPFKLLEVLPEERDRVVRPGDAELDNAVLEDLLDPVPLDVGLALAQRALLVQGPRGGHRRRRHGLGRSAGRSLRGRGEWRRGCVSHGQRGFL